MKPVLERFMEKVNKTDSCWEWTAARHYIKGYGQFKYEGTMKQAHRVAYRLMVGPVPEGLELDHLCNNRACVRPDHLRPVTHAENIARIDHAARAEALRRTMAERRATRTHCVHGHEFTPENTYLQRGVYLTCRICRNAAKVRYLARRASA